MYYPIFSLSVSSYKSDPMATGEKEFAQWRWIGISRNRRRWSN
jgi:hypothetical protein